MSSIRSSRTERRDAGQENWHGRWINLKRYYGFAQPFDFKVAVLFLLSLLGLGFVLFLCLYWSWAGTLSIGTERFYFVLYLTGALLLAAIVSRVTWVSTFLLIWCATELLVGVTSELLQPLGVSTSVLPPNYFTQPPDARFIYHPLLQFVPRPRWLEERKFDLRNRTAPRFSNFPMNWQRLDGLKLLFVHNSLGTRGREPTAADLNRPMIFVYGGSTTYDYHVSQGNTWVELLQMQLHDRYTILNFGVPGYSTTHHLIQTAFYESVAGKKPVCAVYYVGWNDLLNAHIQNLDSAYADVQLLSQSSSVRRTQPRIALYSPILKFIFGKLQQWLDALPTAPSINTSKPLARPDKHLNEIFAGHIATIAAINSSRGIRSVFIGQILNREYLHIHPDRANFGAPMLSNAGLWQLQMELNAVLKDTALAAGATYVDPHYEEFESDDFSDQGHFLASGSRKFAVQVAEPIKNHCGT